MNKYTGVLGVYNCQGAAWNTRERINTFHQTGTDALTSHIRGQDVHLIAEAATDPESWTGDSAVYSHRNNQLVTLPHKAALPVSLKVLEYEVFTVTPIKVLAPGVNFAPLGLIHMFNAGGAIQGLKYEVIHGKSGSVGKVEVQVKGCGVFGAYSFVKPRKATVGSNEVEFTYDSESGLVTLSLDQMPDEIQKFHIVEIEL
ncbi:hypothetical protein Droror1_Dr00023868 [Drosera rotundifolia]